MTPPLPVLAALYAGRPEHTPTVVDVLLEQRGDMIALVCDGATLEFDAAELRAALEPATHTHRAAA